MNKYLLIFLFFTAAAQAQVVLEPDSTGVVKSNDSLAVQQIQVRDSLIPFQRYKAEGVSAVVGEYVILDSDIDKAYVEMQSQGISIEDITRCQLMGKLMEDKLYSHQAKQDSIMVPDAEINGMIDQQMQYMVSELGSEEKVAAYYRKDNIAELRSELFDANKNLKLARMMQDKVIEKVEVTPEEVRTFFFSIPEEERPVFSAEIEIAQIVVDPEITQQAKDEAIAKLNAMRADIIDNGASFATKAVLYSQDPGSSSKGGLYMAVKRDSPWAKEFKDQAFSLLEGEISEPFETEFGYHILYVEKIRGQEVDVRHILIFPEVSQKSIDAAQKKIEDLKTQIEAGEITFAEAARKNSDDKDTRNNGGQLINPITFDTKFDLTKMDPALSAQVYNLTEGEVSKIFTDRDRTGKSSLKILTVTKKYPEHKADYSKDYERIKQLALREKQIKAINKWQNEKIKDTYISINQDYQECDFAGNWMKK
ncbi:peptidylprolyl isomerase [Aequorivita sp. SDUM287046]|uniref:Peptidylprolyl isomerase n=1 Tax=Aequorivita aurantiaca TaxID=3053356 RepID=A0ABT8DJC2_9FLAO|nr:peptidylprolyl isomerase [Aequorivita aurantiaca]MDN3724904.1 peptidylprolyl isomerase [Aequorivita aurantiaca]